ncbi:MAG: ribonuclease HII [Ahrensia sp.]|nr:ribonuclease HII [Ahrensia sp.]
MPDFEFNPQSGPDYRHEKWLTEAGYNNIAGTDEAGRGPLAGPVVAAAVILPLGLEIDGLDDSKKLTVKKRDALFEIITRQAMAISVCSISAHSIDKSDIRKASLEAMRRCLVRLSIMPDAVLIDGRDVPPSLPATAVAKALVKGDGRSMSIAAAAIIAKVTRDKMMVRLGHENPAYGLQSHMGYGSEFHRGEIAKNGGIPRVHRYSFRPLRAK